MTKIGRWIIGAASQIRLPLLPTGFAIACFMTAVTRITYAAVAGRVPHLVALVIGSVPMSAFIAGVVVWATAPRANERPTLPDGPRNGRVYRPADPNQPRNTPNPTTGARAMRNNLDGTYLNGDGRPRNGMPSTGDGTRRRRPIPGREVRYLGDGLDLVAATLPNYSRRPEANQKASA